MWNIRYANNSWDFTSVEIGNVATCIGYVNYEAPLIKNCSIRGVYLQGGSMAIRRQKMYFFNYKLDVRKQGILFLK